MSYYKNKPIPKNIRSSIWFSIHRINFVAVKTITVKKEKEKEKERITVQNSVTNDGLYGPLRWAFKLFWIYSKHVMIACNKC